MFRRKTVHTAMEVLKRHEQMLAQECMKRIDSIGKVSRRLKGGWKEQVRNDVSFIIDVGMARQALQKVTLNLGRSSLQKQEDTGEFHYQISSLCLEDCCRYLTTDPEKNERLHLVTGTITSDSTRVLSRMEKVKYKTQSPAYVRGDEVDTHQKIIALDENHGHLLLAMFHCHVGKGAGATHPSGTDTAFLKRMEKVGCDCLGGIFSMDGYVRFFMEKEFEIDVYGKGVRKVKDEGNHKIFYIEGD